jgi:hypothetical protein
MSTRTNWVETVFDGDPIAALKMIMSSKSTGQIVMNVSQGTVCSVVWRERKVEAVPDSTAPAEKLLDNHPAP